MSFPMKDTRPHPACTPRRPAHGQERVKPGQPARQPARLFIERPLKREGSTQRIEVTSDCLRIGQYRHGKLKATFQFECDDIENLERALEVAKLPTKSIRNAGRAPQRNGETYVEIGAKHGLLLLRVVKACGDHDGFTTLEGEELAAFAMALETFKQSATAPVGAIVK